MQRPRVARRRIADLLPAPAGRAGRRLRPHARRQGCRGRGIRQLTVRQVRISRHAVLERERDRRVGRCGWRQGEHRVAGGVAGRGPRFRHAGFRGAGQAGRRRHRVHAVQRPRRGYEGALHLAALRALFQRVAARAVGGRAGRHFSACPRAKSPPSVLPFDVATSRIRPRVAITFYPERLTATATTKARRCRRRDAWRRTSRSARPSCDDCSRNAACARNSRPAACSPANSTWPSILPRGSEGQGRPDPGRAGTASRSGHVGRAGSETSSILHQDRQAAARRNRQGHQDRPRRTRPGVEEREEARDATPTRSSFHR